MLLVGSATNVLADGNTNLSISIKNGDLTFDFLPDEASDIAKKRTAYSIIKCFITEQTMSCPVPGKLQLSNARPGAITLTFAPKNGKNSFWVNSAGDKIPYNQGKLRIKLDDDQKEVSSIAGKEKDPTFVVHSSPPPFQKGIESITIFDAMAGFSRYTLSGLVFEQELPEKIKKGNYTIEFIATLV